MVAKSCSKSIFSIEMHSRQVPENKAAKFTYVGLEELACVVLEEVIYAAFKNKDLASKIPNTTAKQTKHPKITNGESRLLS